ncbi:hypothetical protein [Kangiella sp. HZ709]|uniref:hypothetical protein n=1 Tax=Kangiella sp. HZ709 TaxID=2666328 RepID=UPI0012AFAAC1|nr:hypothetical protein [Kangiella sp. HZ709]MRX27244.1 hypothetical protein [Kangiella sp. HZ709]
MLDFIKDLLKIGLITFFKLIIAFIIGTGAAAIVCWYYSIPLAFSIVGGFIVLGVWLALMSDSIFD